MVRVYAGKGYNAGVPSATDAYAFWGTLSEMMKYDIIINECECAPYPRDSVGPGYANMAAYLNAGGRVFASHYHLNFYGEQGKADTSLQNAATWTLWGGSSTSSPYLIDTSFPKGKALDEWLFNLSQPGPINGYGSAWAPSVKTTPKGQVQTFGVGDIGGSKPGLSQRWIYPHLDQHAHERPGRSALRSRGGLGHPRRQRPAHEHDRARGSARVHVLRPRVVRDRRRQGARASAHQLIVKRTFLLSPNARRRLLSAASCVSSFWSRPSCSPPPLAEGQILPP